MKKLFSTLVALVVAASVAMPSQARDFVPEGVNFSDGDSVAIMVKDRREGASYISLLFKETTQKDQATLGNRWCLSLSTESCREPGGVLRGSSILPICVADEINCIEGLQIYKADAEPTDAVLDTSVDPGFAFEGDSNLGIPDGSQPSLWSAPKAPTSEGGSQYVVSAAVTFDVTNGKMNIRNFSAAVYPVVEITGTNYKPAEIQQRVEAGVTWYNHDNGEQGSDDGCVLTSTQKCWARTEFAPDTRVRLVLRLTNQISGWLHGRLEAPIISVVERDAISSRVTVDAAPIEVPLLYVETKRSLLDAQAQSILQNPPETGGKFRGDEWAIYDSDGYWTKTLVTKLSKVAGDKAAATYTSWQVNSLQNSWLPGKCFSIDNELLGLITTNALSYSGSTPEWNDGYLSYEVAGLHYLPNGELALGNYEMIMRSDVARCLYGYSTAPISATVTVVGAGDQNIATTFVSEKNGWLTLSASGFTFSEKELKVRITQPQNKTLTKFSGTTRSLTSKQKAEIKVVTAKAKGNPKFICTGVYVNAKDKTTAIKRARAACDYAKSLDKNFSYWAQAKQTKAKNYDGKVMLVSK